MANLLNLWNLIFGLMNKSGVPDGQKTNTLASLALIAGVALIYFGQVAAGASLIVMSGMGAGLRGALQGLLDKLPPDGAK